MARRSKAREVALQMLFQVDLNPEVGGEAVREMIDERLTDPELGAFAWELFAGVMESRGALDERIQQAAENWKLSRMAATDRNLLRLGLYEMLFGDTPFKVAIDEAVELAKRFGTVQSSPFVNGILDRLIPDDQKDGSVE